MIYQQENKRTAMLSLATSPIAHYCNQLNHVTLQISMPRFKIQFNSIYFPNATKRRRVAAKDQLVI